MTIEILYDMPFIFTKDRQWVESRKGAPIRPGEVILLPDDAVLALPPQLMAVSDGKIGDLIKVIIPGRVEEVAGGGAD